MNDLRILIYILYSTAIFALFGCEHNSDEGLSNETSSFTSSVEEKKKILFLLKFTNQDEEETSPSFDWSLFKFS